MTKTANNAAEIARWVKMLEDAEQAHRDAHEIRAKLAELGAPFTVYFVGEGYTLWHVPLSRATPGEPRFLRTFPDGRWQLVASKANDAEIVAEGRI